MGIVYTLAHPETGEVRYVGKTDRNTLHARVAEHKYASAKGRTHLYCWIRSLSDSPVIEILEETTDTYASEQYWISQLRALGCKLVNHTAGGEGKLGYRHSDKTKAKLSTMFKGRKQPWCRDNVKKAIAANKGSIRPKSKDTIKIAQLAATIANKNRIYSTSIRCDQNQTIYATAVQAALALKLDPSSVLKAARKKRLKSTGGYTFSFVEPNLIIEL